MLLPVIPVVIGAGVAVAAWRKFRKPSGMTPERKKIFEAAMRTLKDPVKLRTLADSFEKEGLKAEASELRKRAAIFSASKPTLEARKTVFKKAMSSTKPDAVKKVAKAFHKVGHYEAASSLRKYANGLAAFKSSFAKPKPSGISGKVGLRIGEDDEGFAGEDLPQSSAEV